MERDAASAVEAEVLDRIIGSGTPQRVGAFQFWFEGERWEWSAGVAEMHGYPAAPMTPSTGLLLSHKHPDDREQVASALAKSIANAEPFCSSHRIVDIHGETRNVIVVADTMADDQGAVIGTAGYYVDVTETLEEHRKETLHGTLPQLYASRAVIEQAKGALMVVYGINADQAFRVLIWRSQETNIKLRVLAEQLVSEIGGLEYASPALRTEFDHLLLTVHERIPGD
ncbi:PAS and ANTAR domain-containing protein [Nocardia paucivorans]|uniref:PAS and ANTAR domain-containing protein n=1 Tax=Nocardia paucivorans TaxID=114259 RepID=UPI0002D73160|nr:PAS and ANTAR domain-containing protein [Nocardia paucivorans]